MGLRFDYIVVCTVTGSTHAGMVVGFAADGREHNVIGIDASCTPAQSPCSSSTTRILIRVRSTGVPYSEAACVAVSLSGRTMVNTAPPDCPFCACKLPPCATTICCAIHSPKPLPSGLVVK